MDPGQKLLERLKLVPNLVSEDPATTTPTNSSFMDMPFTEFSKLLDQRRSSAATISSNSSSSSDLSTASDVDNGSMCSWDYQVGYHQEARMDDSK